MRVADGPAAPGGPCGPGSPCGPEAPVAPAGPAGPGGPTGPAGPGAPRCPRWRGRTDAGSFALRPSGTSRPGLGVREALMPFTAPAFRAKAATLRRAASPAGEIVSAAIARPAGQSRRASSRRLGKETSSVGLSRAVPPSYTPQLVSRSRRYIDVTLLAHE